MLMNTRFMRFGRARDSLICRDKSSQVLRQNGVLTLLTVEQLGGLLLTNRTNLFWHKLAKLSVLSFTITVIHQESNWLLVPVGMEGAVCR